MTSYRVKCPAISADGFFVSEWLVSDHDVIEKDSPMCWLTSLKDGDEFASFLIASPYFGVLRSRALVDVHLRVGDVYAVIEGPSGQALDE